MDESLQGMVALNMGVPVPTRVQHRLTVAPLIARVLEIAVSVEVTNLDPQVAALGICHLIQAPHLPGGRYLTLPHLLLRATW
jgi:hypothetical protein